MYLELQTRQLPPSQDVLVDYTELRHAVGRQLVVTYCSSNLLVVHLKVHCRIGTTTILMLPCPVSYGSRSCLLTRLEDSAAPSPALVS